MIILDEPINGVENSTADDIRKMLIEEKNKGKLIIIASHIKEDIETLKNGTYVSNDAKVSKISN